MRGTVLYGPGDIRFEDCENVNTSAKLYEKPGYMM